MSQEQEQQIDLNPPANLEDMKAVEAWAKRVQKHFSAQNSFEGVKAVQPILTLLEKKEYETKSQEEIEQLFMEASFGILASTFAVSEGLYTELHEAVGQEMIKCKKKNLVKEFVQFENAQKAYVEIIASFKAAREELEKPSEEAYTKMEKHIMKAQRLIAKL